jgi:acetylornithine deacetylase/succinyl-diaminopimelate desuccinylase-like protein
MINRGEVVDLLVTLIQNACVNDGTPDGGHEYRSVATLAAYFGTEGHIVEPHPGRQSIVYRVKGSVPGAPRLLLIPHLDVVPALGKGWTRDPFSGDRADGFVWGRGAVDMLNLTAAMAAVFKRYLDGSRGPLPGDLIFAGVADEEAGGGYGAAHLVDRHYDLVECEYALTEVAAPSLATPDGPVLPVTVAEKGPAWRRLTTKGAPGHGSQPYGTRNALIPLADAMNRLGTAPMPVSISSEWRQFVGALGLSSEMEADLLDPDRLDAAIDRLALDDATFARWVHACTHLTMTPTKLDGGIKMNVVPEAAEGFVDVRRAPGQDEATIDDHFRKVLGPDLYDQVDIETVVENAANSSGAAGPLWDAIGDAALDLTGSRALVPAMVPVGTDARFFRERGVIAYGVGLFDDATTFGEMLAMFHGDDERVSEESVGRTTSMLERTLIRFGERLDANSA